MFTAAFRLGDPITPQVLQKLQPLIAIALAALLLGRAAAPQLRLVSPCRPWSVRGCWPSPTRWASACPERQAAAAGALGAAALWAAGTVLGRAASAELRFSDLTALRFTVGFVTLLAITATVTSTPLAIGWSTRRRQHRPAGPVPWAARARSLLPRARPHPGLPRHPRRARLPAHRGGGRRWPGLGASPPGSQWVGFAIVLAAVVGLALHEQRSAQRQLGGGAG
jgi:drug/metabolite transporter (DMT)-like permease